MAAKYMQMLQNMPPRSDRTLEDLANSTDQLVGLDALELRGWAAKSPMVPGRDLTDPLGQALIVLHNGNFDALPAYVASRTTVLGDRAAVVQEMYDARWGPTKIGIYNVVLTMFFHVPQHKAQLLNTTRYLAFDVGVPVDGGDVTGTPALAHAIGTKPFAEPEFAQVLFEAGGSINQLNRFRCTPASDIVQVQGSQDTTRNVAMLKWFFEHGGDVDVKDCDGMTTRMMVEMLEARVPGFKSALRSGRGKREEGDCENCGRKPRGEKAFSACGKCKGRRYCSTDCQRVDWRTHKKSCKASS